LRVLRPVGRGGGFLKRDQNAKKGRSAQDRDLPNERSYGGRWGLGGTSLGLEEGERGRFAGKKGPLQGAC